MKAIRLFTLTTLLLAPLAALHAVEPAVVPPSKPKQWNLTGAFGRTPLRENESWPLSDQKNRDGWVKFEPMWDEFDGPALDTNKWTVGMSWWRGRQPAWFKPSNVAARAGQLHLTMRKEPVPPDMEKHGYKDYTSAALHTRARSSYGYYEIKARPMNSAGSSSFWFQNEDRATHPDWATEIDVFELCGKSEKFERKYHMNLHVFRTPQEKRHWSVGGEWVAPWRFADDFHVYGFEWGREELRWFVDGVRVRTVANTHWHQPLHLIFDSETMPDWLGMPNDADLPSTFNIEYVRAWTHPTADVPTRSASPKIAGPYVRVYIPGEDVFPGPDSPNFKAGQSYSEWVPNDHAILKGPEGRWHALGITHPKPPDYQPPRYGKGIHEAEWLLFHAVAPVGTLKQHLKTGAWRDQAKVLAPSARPGEIKECHAPFIVCRDGLNYMIYGPSPLRLATSTNLHDWQPVGPLFAQQGGARDPNLLFHDGHYILYYVTGNAILARTSTDLRNWSADAVEVFRMRRGGDPESPSIVEHGGHFYLSWCLWDAADEPNGAYDNRTFVFRSSNPLDFRSAPCVAELKAHAPEVFRDEDGDWFISSVEWPHRGVSIAPLAWE